MIAGESRVWSDVVACAQTSSVGPSACLRKGGAARPLEVSQWTVSGFKHPNTARKPLPYAQDIGCSVPSLPKECIH